MTAQTEAPAPLAALKTTVTSGQHGQIVVEALVEGVGTYEVTLDRRDLGSAGFHMEDECEPWCDQRHASDQYVERLEELVSELHRVAHHDPGDRDTAFDCLRYPCRRLGLT